MNVLIGAAILLFHAATGTVVTIYPLDVKPVPVSVDDVKQVACPILSQEARHLVDPVTYQIQWMRGNGDGTTTVADDKHVVSGPIPDCKDVKPQIHRHAVPA
jgi:hypothetical protein